jgi:hypothetical protein
MELRDKIQEVRRLLPPGNPVSKKEALKDLKLGSGIRISSSSYVVAAVYDYQEYSKKGNPKDFHWKEYRLVNLETFEDSFLEVEDDDGVSVYLTGEKVSVARFPDNEKPGDKKLHISGFGSASPFYLDEICHAKFSDGNSEEKVISYDYEGDDEHTLIGVEVWEDGNMKAYTYSEINLSTVEVFAHE